METSKNTTVDSSYTQESAIQNYFSGKTVFITGTTGFIGRMLLEKLLRSCPGIEKIYVLLRSKKGKEAEQRFDEIFDVPAFDPLKKIAPNFADKTSILIGDLTLPGLGLSEKDRRIIEDDVQCVFHCAATVRFDETIRTAGYINVRSVRDLLRIAKEMKLLTSFVHISTAFAHCPRKTIAERYYTPGLSGEKFLNILDSLNDHILDEITPVLLQDWPNTYTFTKAIAEDVVKTEANDLPVAIVRPSIILGSYNEPVPGWIDNIYGPTGLVIGVALGVIRSLWCVRTKNADLVPADYVVNTIIAASREVGTKCSPKGTTIANGESSIYNYVNSSQNPVDWGTYTVMVEKSCRMFPSPVVIWHSFFRLNSSKLLHTLSVIFLHNLPAYVVDFVFVCIRKRPLLVKAYKKIDKFTDVTSYFTTQEWDFTNDNVQKLWNSLNDTDKELFQFDISAMKWEDYFISYVKGVRSYLLKDTLETIPRGRRKLRLLKIAHYTLVTFLLVLLYKFITCVCSYVF